MRKPDKPEGILRVAEMVVSIGEVVWDLFPDRQVLGGAPLNVAYHLHTMGIEVEVVSRLGSDELGAATRAKIGTLGLSTAGVQEDPDLPTGRVRVTLGTDREPRFEIVAPAAWDAIEPGTARRAAGDRTFALVFGTLGQRDPRSRAAIRGLWEQAAVRFYDVNLRPPWTTRDLVLESLAAADVVKLNEKELAEIGGWLRLREQDEKRKAAALRDHYGLAALTVTLGERGALLATADGCCAQPGVAVAVKDTVGAGDAFFAALIEGLLRGRPGSEILTRANRRGAYVASKDGATPPMPLA